MAFRFFASFYLLYAATGALSEVPGFSWVSRADDAVRRVLVSWFGRVVLRMDQPMDFSAGGSGDKLSDWVGAALMLGLAAVAALAWSGFDHGRRADGWVRDFLRIALRYTLASSMLSYGILKLLHLQMSGPQLARLIETYGESSPMGLAWTFMGLSWPYSAFAGGLEFVGGLLLFFRRTTALGALLLVAVMANVFAMNLCFDIPVKLYSGLMLSVSIVLAAPALPRLVELLVWHRNPAPLPRDEHMRPWPAGRLRPYVSVIKALIVINIVWDSAGERTWQWLTTPPPARPEIYGLYEVERFTREGVELPPLLSDGRRWRRVLIESRLFTTVILMDERRLRFQGRLSANPDRLWLRPAGLPEAPRQAFRFQQPAPDRLVLSGQLDGVALTVELRRADESKLLLINRGFHWISERPFNR